MKKTINRIIKFTVFALALTGAIVIAYKALKWKDTTGEYLSSMEQLYGTEDNLMDVVFVGSSHCYCGIYPAILWRDCGISAFDMSVSGQDCTSAYYDLTELYKTQNPKVVYVDIYSLFVKSQGVEANQYRNYLAMDPSANSVNKIKAGIKEKEERADYYLQFPIVHTRYAELQRKDFVSYAPNYFSRGAYYSRKVGTARNYAEAEASTEVAELAPDETEWLENMINLTRAHGSQIEFILIPFDITEPQQAVINAVSLELESRGIGFTNYNTMRAQVGLDFASDYMDVSHLNAYGAEKLTMFLEEELVNKYHLQDHRGDEKYSQWEKDYRWYQNICKKQVLTETSDPALYVETLLDYDDAWTVLSLDGEFYNFQYDYFAALAPLGMDYDDYLTGGKWLYRNGELTKLCENEPGACAYLELNRYDTLRVGYYGQWEAGNLLIGTTEYQKMCYLTFLTYDTLVEELVATGEY